MPGQTTPLTPLSNSNIHIPVGGFDRSNAPHASSADTWFDLLNLRPENGTGQLKQTPLLALQGTLPALNTDNGAEGSSQVRFIEGQPSGNYICGTEKYLRYFVKTFNGTIAQTQIPVVLQTAIPNNVTINGEVLLYGVNLTDFAATNDQIDVVIDGATTFKWRRNGGGYTALVPIAATVAIGANGLTLAFMATDGYTINDTWSWKRTALPYAGTYPLQKVELTNFKADAYITGYDRAILRVRDNIATGVGYKRVWGRYVAVFYNHLMVGQFATSNYSAGAPVDSYDAKVTPWRLGWSHLNDPDQFFQTDLNEADQYDIPANHHVDVPIQGITGMKPLGNFLITYLPDTMYTTTYVGLPNVMQTDQLNTKVGSMFDNGVVTTPYGHYFIARDNIYRFDGSQVVKVGFPVFNKFMDDMSASGTIRQQLFGHYDADKCEVQWTYWFSAGVGLQCRQMCYQIDYNRWYFRNMPSTQISQDVRCITGYTEFTRRLYGCLQKIYIDEVPFAGGELLDTNTAGTGSYTQPYAETQDLIYGDLLWKKLASSVYPDAFWTFVTSVFNADTALTVAFQARNRASETASLTNLALTWDIATTERILSLPQAAGAVHRYRFKFTGTKPIGCIFSGWQDFVNLPNKATQ